MAQQHQGNPHALSISNQHLIAYNEKSRSPNAPTIMTESQATPPVITDQFHHTETIWRIIVDITSLITCKNENISLEKFNFYFFSACCYGDITFCCSTIYTRLFLFGYNNKISI